MMIGRVDDVDGHFIATRFVAMTIPVESVYISRTVSRASTSTPNAPDRLKIRVDWRSIGLGYARLWFPLLAVVLPTAIATTATVPAAIFVLSAALLAGSAASYRVGRLTEREKAKLRLLGTVTGLRVDPSRLQRSTREIKRASLGELMDKGGIPLSASEIIEVIDDIPMPAMPLVYGYVRYAGDDAAWRDCAALVFQRYEEASDV